MDFFIQGVYNFNMIYENIRPAVFLDRPNRFIANIELAGKREICHVKNTGRCRELLISGAEIYVQEAKNPNRSTKYDLISVRKGKLLVNMDSSAPNKIFAEWLQSGGISDVSLIKPEYKHGASRFDFYVEAPGKKILIEVKGVTLEENGIARFPDAPTERGLRHITELGESMRQGFDAMMVFIIQMEGMKLFTPNYDTHPEFGGALKLAENLGVKLLALDCRVTPDSLTLTVRFL